MPSWIHSSSAHTLEQTQVSTAPHPAHLEFNANMRAVQCFTSTVNEKKSLGLTALVTVLDILSDLMGMYLFLYTGQINLR